MDKTQEHTKNHYGEIVTLKETIENVECWNWGGNQRCTLQAGTRIRILRIYDSYHTTVEHLGNGDTCVEHPEYKRAYRFIVNNIHLSDAAGVYIPTQTADPIGDLIAADA